MSPEYLQRFSGLARLYGQAALPRLHRSSVCVIGVGGVGSWIVEALARSGVGALTLVDLDDVCITNINRQLPALTSTVGKPKIRVLAERVLEINPECLVTEVPAFVSETNLDALLPTALDLVIDAVDRTSIKAAIIAWAVRRGTALITSGSAGGRLDPTAIRVADLGLAGHDALLQQVRRKLRKDYGFPKAEDGKAMQMNVPCVYSRETPRYPLPDGTCASAKPVDAESGLRLDCAGGLGAATHVTGTFALMAAGEALRMLVGER